MSSHLCTVDEYKHLGCQSDKIWCSQDSTWGPLDYEAKTLPLDQQVKYNEHASIHVGYQYVGFFIINITFCDFSEFFEIFKSKLFKISQSPVRFDFFPMKYGPILSYVFNPRMVRLGTLCKIIASKVAFYIVKLTNLWKHMLDLGAKLIFSWYFIVWKCNS